MRENKESKRAKTERDKNTEENRPHKQRENLGANSWGNENKNWERISTSNNLFMILIYFTRST